MLNELENLVYFENGMEYTNVHDTSTLMIIKELPNFIIFKLIFETSWDHWMRDSIECELRTNPFSLTFISGEQNYKHRCTKITGERFELLLEGMNFDKFCPSLLKRISINSML